MKLPIKIYVNEVTVREWLNSDIDDSKCYQLQIQHPDLSMNIGKFICSQTDHVFKINYWNECTGESLPNDKALQLLNYINN